VDENLAPVLLAEIQLPILRMMTPCAVRTAESVAERLGLAASESMQVQLAVEEAFVNAADHFAAVATCGDVAVVSFHLSADMLILSVREKGIPFAGALLHSTKSVQDTKQNSGDDLAALEKAGLGTSLMQSVMDSVDYLVHGRDGKEVLMKKRLHTISLAPDLATYLSPKRGRLIRKTAVNPVIRRATPDDAVEISRAAWRTYGYSQSELLYDADELRKRIENGSLVSFIAKSEGCFDVIFHCALEYHEPGTKVPEGGLLFADPMWRCSGLTKSMADIIHVHAREAGNDGFFDCCVTTHTYSQQAAQERNAVPCCLMIGIAPAGTQIKLPGIGLQHKGSTLNHYVAFNRNPATVYVPAKHQHIIKDIYSWMQLPRTMISENTAPLCGETDVFFIPLPEANNVVFIVVNTIGSDAIEQVVAYQKQCIREKRDACFVFMPLGNAASGVLACEIEKVGFVFCGVMPHIHNGDDRLILQYVMTAVEADQIRVYGDHARRLKDYVVEQMSL